MTDHVKDKFVTPVRQLLMSTKMHCKHELETRQEVKGHSNPPEDSKGPKVTMEVSGEKLSAKEELQVSGCDRMSKFYLLSVYLKY